MQKINVDNLDKLDVFSHAVVAGDFVFVSGTLGMASTKLEIVPGGIGPTSPPARITISRAGLHFGAAIEVDCVAYKPKH